VIQEEPFEILAGLAPALLEPAEFAHAVQQFGVSDRDGRAAAGAGGCRGLTRRARGVRPGDGTKLYGEMFARVPRHSGRTVVEQTAPEQARHPAAGGGDAAA